ncbi:MAG: hypothetical protein K0S51_1224 [Bacillales bacterium]|jgi:hypothetical protein|nr:hypothetical protein [Bacillales bacterium]
MMKKFSLLSISIILLVISVAVWQFGNYFSAPGEMDRANSFAIIGFSGTALFMILNIILILKSLFTKGINSRKA